MCTRTRCRICNKYTWSGCGNHVSQVMAGIPKSERCKGHTREEIAEANKGGFFSKLFGR